MRDNEHYALDDPEAVRDLIRQHPWCTFVSATPALVATHYPVMLDETADDMATTRRPAPIGSVC